MSTRRVRSGMSCLVLASMLVIPSALAQASASHTAKGQSDATLAHKINVAAGDLPTETVWIGAQPTAATCCREGSGRTNDCLYEEGRRCRSKDQFRSIRNGG